MEITFLLLLSPCLLIGSPPPSWSPIISPRTLCIILRAPIECSFRYPFSNMTSFLFLRRREVIFEKGYLKEHSIGALKIMHKVLGDIIGDHEGGGEPIKRQGDSSSKKVISISELVEKRKK